MRQLSYIWHTSLCPFLQVQIDDEDNYSADAETPEHITTGLLHLILLVTPISSLTASSTQESICIDDISRKTSWGHCHALSGSKFNYKEHYHRLQKIGGRCWDTTLVTGNRSSVRHGISRGDDISKLGESPPIMEMSDKLVASLDATHQR